MIRLTCPKTIRSETVRINGRKTLILRSKKEQSISAGLLWIHGGGYITGMKEMVYMSRGVDLVTKFGAVVVSPGYRWQSGILILPHWMTVMRRFCG